MILLLAPVGGAAGVAPGSGGTDAATDTASFGDGIQNPGAPVEFGTQGDVDPALQEADGTVEVIFRFDEIDRASLQGVTRQAAIRSMKQHSAATQQNFLRYAGSTEGIETVERFWIANAVLAEVDTDEVNIERVTEIKGVDRAHANFELTVPENLQQERASADDVRSASYNTTYGLDQINATEVWDEYDTQGEGVGVAVLDTGVDPDHPDINIDPDNFVEATEDGVENVDPYDSSDHGTHVSGTVVGGNASGEYIGVAPDAELYHGLVIPGGSGSFAQVASGMEWAANESGVDVVSMSLGAEGYFTEMIEPTQNIEAAGKVLVASAGNSYEGSSGSPGNVYESIAAGASNEDGGIASFSSGEEVDTEADWGDAAPSDWPDTYIVPDYAAPGVAVKSAQPGGGYQELSGTSMAAPHISGAYALMLSAAGDIDKSTATEALTETAWAPTEDPDPTRYGDGIIDIKEATDMVALEQEITGTVTDEDGSAIGGASVSTDQGFEATTNEDGEYTVLAETGNVTVTADAFGAESSSQTVEVGDNETVTANFSLGPALGVSLESGQASAVEGGQNVSATVQVANLETYTAELGDGFSAENATVYLNGNEIALGEPVDLGDYSGMATVTVETADGSSGDLSVVHTFEGAGDSLEVTTGPTEVFAEFTQVGVVDDDGEYGSDVASRAASQLPASYELTVIDADTAIDSTGEYDAFVVQQIDEENAEAFADATASVGVGTVYLDQWGSDSNGIEARSSAIGAPAEVDDDLGDESSYTNIATDHPVFDGIDSDTVQIHTGIDVSYFNGAEGTVLADAQFDGDTVPGSGAAVSEERWDVLGAGLGSTLFVNGDEFTEEANTILANMVEVAANPPEPAGTVEVTETTVSPGSNAEVTLQTDVSNVSGYEATIEFDPEKLQVKDVSGEDMADPVMEVDNENGVLFLTQAQAEGADAPEMASIEFEVVDMDNGEEAEVSLVGSESAVFGPDGDSYLTNWDNGHVTVLDGQLGDVNADGEITAGDAVIVQRYIAGLPTEVPDDQIEMLGDVNQDGQITSADVTYILQIVAGIEEPPEMNAADTQSSVTAPSVESTATPSAPAL
ncbi:S8 family serine peptidase [Halorubrum sp. T3]|uniref:S8 family serine peptidase n=1 Tax=Halorubrum sp. T3 TaxID=1194088 RepID=UPI001ED98C33|nr:S8 family serine peptidase [Halorubrum sp. T3]